MRDGHLGNVSQQCVETCVVYMLTRRSDFAEEYPDSDVTGIDLSPIQPSLLPSNCHFVIDDCTKPWSFPEDYFDLVHVRALFGSVADWPAFYKEALR